MINDIASVQAQPTQPTLVESFHDQRAVRPYVVKRSAQGVEVIKIPPHWTWQVEPVKRALECLSLTENWDSYGGQTPSHDTVLSVIDFISMIPFDNLPRPRVVPLASGGIQLEWSTGSRELDIEFRPDGLIEFLRVEGDSDGEEGKLVSFTPDHVKSLIAWLIVP